MNVPTSGSCVEARPASSPASGSRGDAVRAVEVLVDVLDEVGDPQLREHVVARVVVDLAGALGRLQPGVEARRPRSGGAGRLGRVGDPAADDGSAARRRRRRRAGSPPSSRPGRRAPGPRRRPCRRAPRCPTTDTGCPTWSPGNGSSGPITLVERHRLGLGQVDGLGGAVGLPRVVLPDAQARPRCRPGRAPAGARPSSAGRAGWARDQRTQPAHPAPAVGSAATSSSSASWP